MSKKTPNNDQKTTATSGKPLERTVLDGKAVDELADGLELILNRLRIVAKNMQNRGISISVKGIPTWETTVERLNSTSQTIESAWFSASKLSKKVAEKREKFESGSE